MKSFGRCRKQNVDQVAGPNSMHMIDDRWLKLCWRDFFLKWRHDALFAIIDAKWDGLAHNSWLQDLLPPVVHLRQQPYQSSVGQLLILLRLTLFVERFPSID